MDANVQLILCQVLIVRHTNYIVTMILRLIFFLVTIVLLLPVSIYSEDLNKQIPKLENVNLNRRIIQVPCNGGRRTVFRGCRDSFQLNK